MNLILRYDEFGNPVVVAEHEDIHDAQRIAIRFSNDTPGVTYVIRGAEGELIGKVVRGSYANTNE